MSEDGRDLSKLPKWCQEHIHHLQRERDTAVRALQRFMDDQTEAPIFFDDLLCIGQEDKGPTHVRKYVNGTRSIQVIHAGVQVQVYATEDDGIRMSWGCVKRGMSEAAFIPVSYQCAHIKMKELMR